MRVVLYARYSTHLQNERSVDDQFAVCEERCVAEGWTVVRKYSDKAMSGSSMAQRTGLLELIEAARRGEFDLVVAESLDRISRDQEETAGINKRLKFAGVGIHTLAEGRINEMHVGFKGTMNALELQHIAARVRRGQLGSVKGGKLHGGKAYGYRTVRTTENPTGLREVVPQEAEIIRRIFSEYNSGMSPIAIAKKLNAEGVPGPTGGAWRHTTITGSRKRVNGILRNPFYVGTVLWGRNYIVRDPDTGRRIMRSNDPSQFVAGEISDELKDNLTIIDEETWSAAQKRLSETGRVHLTYRTRPRHLLSGLVRCKECGGPFIIDNRDRMCCSNHRNKGICTVPYSIARAEIETRVINAVTTKLADPELLDIYREEYVRERRERFAAATVSRPRLLKKQAELKAKLDRLSEHMASGELSPVAMPIVRQQLNKAAEELQIVETELKQAPAVEDSGIPANFAERLLKQLPNLRHALEATSQMAHAAKEILRNMIDEILVEPIPGRATRIDCPWNITVKGPIQSVLEMPDVDDFPSQISGMGISPFARRGLMVPPA